MAPHDRRLWQVVFPVRVAAVVVLVLICIVLHSKGIYLFLGAGQSSMGSVGSRYCCVAGYYSDCCSIRVEGQEAPVLLSPLAPLITSERLNGCG